MPRSFLAVPLLLALPAAAQQLAVPADTAGRALSEVTVYATRVGQTEGQAGRYVTVVPGAALARYPVNSLDDLLRLLPNMEVQSRGSFGTQADITLRGSTFNQVLLLLDGVRLNDPLTGHFAGYFPITPAEIEQIEVVRGPGAALYGPDAVGGFINIVTKTFAATHRPDGVQAGGTFLAGEWGLKSTNIGFSGQDRGVQLAGGVLNNTAAGQLVGTPDGARNDFKLTTYSLSGSCRITPRLSAAARASFDRREYGARFFYTTNPGDQARETTTRDWYQGQLRYEWSARHRTEVQLAASSSTDLYLYTPTSVASDHLMHTLLVQGQHYYTPGPAVRLTVGGQLDRRAVLSNDRGDHSLWHQGAFVVAALTPLPGLSLTPALRLDHDASYGTELVPQLNASYQVAERLTVRGAAGRGIRAPNFTEQYNSAIRPGVVPGGFNVGNPTLAAERTWSYEVGLDYRPRPALTLRGTYFNRYGRNLIDYVSASGTTAAAVTGFTNLNPTATYRLAQNLFAVSTQGLETEVSARADLAPGLRLDGSAGYTWVHLNVEGDVVSQYLTGVARHLVSGSVGLTHRHFGLYLGGVFKQRDAARAAALSRELTPSYAVFNLRLEAGLVPDRVWATAQALNLFNAQYADLLGAQMPSRWLMAGVRVALRR